MSGPTEPNRAVAVLGLVGTGQMGRGIAQIAAAAGVTVRLFDTRAGAAAEAREFVGQMFGRAVAKGRMDAAAADAALARLVPDDGLDALADCDVVVEAVIEDLAAKQELFGRLEGIVRADCILASNTSSLSITRIAAACRRPGRVAGFHFFNPVPLMKVVEVIAGARTEPAVCRTLAELARRMGHRPVQAKDTPGFLVNHAGRGYGLEALRILSEGVAGAADIDRIMREAAGFPMGPFELLDLTGMDVSHPVMESIYHQFYEEPRFRPSPETARRLAAGLLGRKSGEGFYRYTEGKAAVPGEEPAPDERPSRAWISPADPDAAAMLRAFLEPLGTPLVSGDHPPDDGLLLVTPYGTDATTAASEQGLDPARTVAVDALLGLGKRITLMSTPLTAAAHRRAAQGLFASGGVPVTMIADSPGFVAQRILAAVVNVGCDIAQHRISIPEDIDDAVRLGLGYPAGPLTLGDRLGRKRLLGILERLHSVTGDPRWRPSLWLRRRALLDISLRSPDLAD